MHGVYDIFEIMFFALKLGQDCFVIDDWRPPFLFSHDHAVLFFSQNVLYLKNKAYNIKQVDE